MANHVVIVGAGLGGLCTGIRLLHHGYQVSIYEKNAYPGGVVRTLTSPDGSFTFDESASIGINPLTYLEIFDAVQKDPSDYFEWTLLQTHYKVFWKNGPTLTLSAHLAETQKSLLVDFPQDAQAYTQFICDTSAAYLESKQHLLNQPYLHVRDLLTPKTLYHLLKIHPLSTANTYISRYISSPALKELLLFQTFFMGISPYKLPAIYTAIPANSQLEGIAYIKGGLGAYSQALAKLFTDLGGTLHYHHNIDQVVLGTKKAKGIRCNNKLITADQVVLGTDYTYSMHSLMHQKPLRRFKHSCSTFIIHLGLDKHYETLSVHNLLINTHFKEEIQRLFKGQLPIQPSLYLYAPSCIDKDLCTYPSHSVLNIMVRVPNLSATSIHWDTSTQNHLYTLCLDTVTTLPGLSDLKEHILYHAFTTPVDFAKKYHYTQGSCFGIGHTFFQSLAFRPQIQSKDYSNLYFVGASIHPGNGASIVMDCAKLLVNTLIKT